MYSKDYVFSFFMCASRLSLDQFYRDSNCKELQISPGTCHTSMISEKARKSVCSLSVFYFSFSIFAGTLLLMSWIYHEATFAHYLLFPLFALFCILSVLLPTGLMQRNLKHIPARPILAWTVSLLRHSCSVFIL